MDTEIDFYAVDKVTDPQWEDEAKTTVKCLVFFTNSPFDPNKLGLPFHATASDCMPHGKQIFADLVAGKYGDIAPYVAP